MGITSGSHSGGQ
jgi:hypothetical protein